jgi:hypothetical protein
MTNTLPLDLKVQRPTKEVAFAAAQLRALASEFYELADAEDDDDPHFKWTRAAAKASCRARDLDNDEPFKHRIQLTETECIKLAGYMDEYNYRGHWHTGRSAAIDWTTFELVVDGEYGLPVVEVLGWTKGSTFWCKEFESISRTLTAAFRLARGRT